ncbi:MAG: hypothetical protein KDK33_09185 [Leptospiraceae bacterium]|nr:hypothetical protein [Leptospiraceae bacterium]
MSLEPVEIDLIRNALHIDAGQTDETVYLRDRTVRFYSLARSTESGANSVQFSARENYFRRNEITEPLPSSVLPSDFWKLSPGPVERNSLYSISRPGLRFDRKTACIYLQWEYIDSAGAGEGCGHLMHFAWNGDWKFVNREVLWLS